MLRVVFSNFDDIFVHTDGGYVPELRKIEQYAREYVLYKLIMCELCERDADQWEWSTIRTQQNGDGKSALNG